MTRRIAKHIMGIQDDDKDTHRRDTILTDIQR